MRARDRRNRVRIRMHARARTGTHVHTYHTQEAAKGLETRRGLSKNGGNRRESEKRSPCGLLQHPLPHLFFSRHFSLGRVMVRRRSLAPRATSTVGRLGRDTCHGTQKRETDCGHYQFVRMLKHEAWPEKKAKGEWGGWDEDRARAMLAAVIRLAHK